MAWACRSRPAWLRGQLPRLFWPSKTDFVRVAARFDAVVVPFGGVGADDNAQVLASLGDLRRQAEGLLPFMARSEKRRGGLMPVSESLATWKKR